MARNHHVFVVSVFAALLLAAGALGESQSTTGMASWYGAWHEGRLTASGCVFHAGRISAASRTLPLGAWINVRNLRNNLSTVVQVTDRGPYVRGRVLDLSRAAAAALGAVSDGVIPVRIELLRVEKLRCR